MNSFIGSVQAIATIINLLYISIDLSYFTSLQRRKEGRQADSKNTSNYG